MKNFLNHLSFSLRQDLWGRLVLRPGLPKINAHSVERKQEARFYQRALGKAFSPEEAREIALVVDVGCRNWSYARGLAEFFPSASLAGYELDGLRRYWNLYRRIDYAKAYARDLVESGKQVQCESKDFLEVDGLGQADGAPLFCFFFPFVSESPCLAWGLPTRYADFGKLIAHACKLAALRGTPGEFFSLHQGDWEAELARAAYREHRVRVLQEGSLAPREFQGLWPSGHEVWFFRGTGGALLAKPQGLP